ncbi:MAG: zf-HC2 domain-containing protein [Burkholderiales bacterium]|nr:zf-HC2 domain-containing protein [Burkholderiales bacterium]GIK88009.1 MAG: hypothetical protein BroJett026_34900 [Betaproteobacteria bacterium]
MNKLARRISHLISCREATELVSQLRERPLSPLERVKLRLHLAACKACSRFERQLALLDEAMRRYRR